MACPKIGLWIVIAVLQVIQLIFSANFYSTNIFSILLHLTLIGLVIGAAGCPKNHNYILGVILSSICLIVWATIGTILNFLFFITVDTGTVICDISESLDSYFDENDSYDAGFKVDGILFEDREDCINSYDNYYNAKVLIDILTTICMIVCAVLLCKHQAQMKKEEHEKEEKEDAK